VPLHLGVTPLHWASAMHSTQVMPFLHLGVPPMQATQVAPHLASVLQLWQVLAASQYLPEPQSLSTRQATHLSWVVSQSGLPETPAQLASAVHSTQA